MEVRSRDGRSVVCLRSGERDIVEAVLQAFRDMGAANIAKERTRLQTDTAYFADWCQDMPDWHDGAFYMPVCTDRP